jgi:dolichol-phosphate mannosyltransferase
MTLKQTPRPAKYGVTIVVLAYNEEQNLPPAIGGIVDRMRGVDWTYEIVIIDDGSTDATGRVADRLAEGNHRIRVIHHPHNIGFGRTFTDGVAAAKQPYVIGFPGDNDTSPMLVADLVRHAGDADLVMSYPRRTDIRSAFREGISKTFVVAMNAAFGLRLKYYNGSFICRTEALRAVPLTAKGFAVYAEAKVRMIRKGMTFAEIPFDHIGRKYGVSKAVSAKSVMHTLETMVRLFAGM